MAGSWPLACRGGAGAGTVMTGDGWCRAGREDMVDPEDELTDVRMPEQLPVFEQGLTAALDGGTASVLCQYDWDRFDPVTLASVAAFHPAGDGGDLRRRCGAADLPPVRAAWDPDRRGTGLSGRRAAGAGAGRGGPPGGRPDGQHGRAGVHRRPVHAHDRGRGAGHGRLPSGYPAVPARDRCRVRPAGTGRGCLASGW